MWKHYFYYLLIIVLLVPSLIFFASREIERHYLKIIETNLKHQAELTEELLENHIPYGEVREIDELAKRIGKRISSLVNLPFFLNPELTHSLYFLNIPCSYF